MPCPPFSRKEASIVDNGDRERERHAAATVGFFSRSISPSCFCLSVRLSARLSLHNDTPGTDLAIRFLSLSLPLFLLGRHPPPTDGCNICAAAAADALLETAPLSKLVAQLPLLFPSLPGMDVTGLTLTWSEGRKAAFGPRHA